MRNRSHRKSINKPSILRPIPDPVSEVFLSYVLNTPEDQRAMLAAIGVSSIEELFNKIPSSLRLKRPLQIHEALSEIELTSHLAQLAGRNRPAGDAVCFLGGGAY